MKTSIYAASAGRRYAIVEMTPAYIVLRYVPDDEYWKYYRERRDEIWMDEGYGYWLLLRGAKTQEAAERYLASIGVDCKRDEKTPRKEGEGQFPTSEYHMRGITCV